LIHKAKQRLTKIHQYLIRMRKLKLQVRTKLVGVNRKKDKIEARKEHKALKAADITKAIKNQLVERLKAVSC
jgi:protein MAK16